MTEKPIKDEHTLSKNSPNDDDSTSNKKSSNDMTSSSVVRKKWSEALQTPSTAPCFSPAYVVETIIPSNKNNLGSSSSSSSLHGLGLSLVVNRARNVSICGKKCAKLLYEISILYETFAQNILKSKFFLQNGNDVPLSSSLVGVSDDKDTNGYGGSSTAAAAVLDHPSQTKQYVSTLKCMASIRSFAMQLQGLAICIRNDISRPLRDISTSVGDAAPKIYQKYDRSRNKSVKARERAMEAQRRYAASVRQAEKLLSEIVEVKKATQETFDTENFESSGDTNDAKETSSEKLDNINGIDKRIDHGDSTSSASDYASGKVLNMSSSSIMQAGWDGAIRIFSNMTTDDNSHMPAAIAALKHVKRCQNEYLTAVDDENAAVSRCQTIEVMALKSIENLEGDRMKFFIQTMERTAQAEQGCLDKMALQILNEPSEQIGDTVMSQAKTNKLDKTRDDEKIDLEVPPNISFPDEVIMRRGNALISLTDTKNRYRNLSNLAHSLEVTLNSAEAFSKSLNERLQYDGYIFDASSSKHRPDHFTLSNIIQQYESKGVLESWDAVVIKSLMHLTKNIILSFIDPLKIALNDKFNKLKTFSEKEIISATESERVRWRHLCDAKQNELMHKARLDTATTNLNKATERLHAIAGAGKANDSIDFLASKDDITTHLSKSMRQSIGGLFQSVLGDSETLSNSVLTADDRYQLAQNALSEAVYKDEHAKASYKAASTALNLAIESYKTAATVLVTTSRKQEEVVWNKAKVTLTEYVSMLDKFRNARYIHLEKLSKVLTEISHAEDIDSLDWITKLESKLTLHRQKILAQLKENASSQGFVMEAYKIKSKAIDTLMAREDGEKTDFAFLEKEKTRGESQSSIDNTGKAITHEFDEEGIEAQVIRKVNDNEVHTQKIDIKLFESMPDDFNDCQKDDNTQGSPTAITPPQRQQNRTSTINADTEMFLEHFFPAPSPESPNNKTFQQIPTVIQSFSCAYWPKDSEGHMSPLLHGRMFATSESCYFVGWAGKKIVFNWVNATRVEKEVTFYGLVPNAILITCEDGKDYLFGSFLYREEAFNLLNRLSIVARSVVEFNGGSPSLPKTDSTLAKMQIIVNENLVGVNVRQLFQTCWDESLDEDNKNDPVSSFYATWLKTQEVNFDVYVGSWEKDENGFINQWCGEKYTRKRVVKFKFRRSTHLYIGPPTANVTETQFSRIEEGDETCIIASNVKVDGIPYADTFSVEYRWIGKRLKTKTGSSCVQIQVGIFVNFKKSSLLNSKIRSSTLEETKITHSNFFGAVKKACNGSSIEPTEVEDQDRCDVEEKRSIQFFMQNSKRVLRYFGNMFQQKQNLFYAVLAFIYLSLIFLMLTLELKKLQYTNEMMLSEMKELKNEILRNRKNEFIKEVNKCTR